MYTVKIKTIEPITVAALRYVGPYQEIGPVFCQLYGWAAGRNLTEKRLLAIYYDDPGQVPPEQCRADAAIAVPAGFAVDAPATQRVIPGGRYASVIHQGPYTELHRAYSWLYRTWLPQSGEAADDRPCFEEYLNDPSAVPPAEYLTEVHMPLR